MEAFGVLTALAVGAAMARFGSGDVGGALEAVAAAAGLAAVALAPKSLSSRARIARRANLPMGTTPPSVRRRGHTGSGRVSPRVTALHTSRRTVVGAGMIEPESGLDLPARSA